MCKLNLFTFRSMYKYFIAQIGGREKFLSVNDAEPFGIFLILEVYMFPCLFYYIHDEPMCHQYHIIISRYLRFFSNRSIAKFTRKLYYHFLKC